MYVPRRARAEDLARLEGYIRGWENEVASRGLFGGVWNAVGATGQPGWQNGSTGTAEFMLDTEGFVYLRGTARDPAGAAATMFTLPVGYRPPARVAWMASGSDSSFNILAVDSSGNVHQLWNSGADQQMYDLDGFAFRIV